MTLSLYTCEVHFDTSGRAWGTEHVYECPLTRYVPATYSEGAVVTLRFAPKVPRSCDKCRRKP